MELTPSQIEAIQCSAPCLQVVACAGSGKTEVLARRVLKFLSDGIEPSGIVAFTFTEKAAEELKERIDRRAGEAGLSFGGLPPSSAGLFAGTIHSYCLRLLQSSGELELHDVLTEDREWALAYRFAKRLGLVSLYEETWPGERVSRKTAVDVFLQNLSVVYNEMIPHDKLRRCCPSFADAVRRYEALTEALRVVSFDQIIARAVSRMRPGGSLRKLVEGRVRQVLVDEYQDLNRAQEALLLEMASSGAGITVVGDDDQAIYQWRGGDVSLFHRFAERFGAVRKSLGLNKRSKPSIVRFSRAFARTIEPRLDKDIACEGADEERCVELIVAQNPGDEASAIAARVRKLIDEGVPPGDIAVLFRSIRTSAAPVLKALSEAGIPAAIAGKVSLLDRPETRLVTHVFVWWAGGSWRPAEAEERVTEELLVQEIREVTGRSEEQARRVLASLERLGDEVRQHGVRDLIRTYTGVLTLLGLPGGTDRAVQEKSLGAMSSLLVGFENSVKRGMPEGALSSPELVSDDPGVQEENREDAVVSGAAERGEPLATGDSTGPRRGEIYLWWLRGFLERFSSEALEVSSEGVERVSGAVNILTVHQAKGLEFSVVFVPSLVDGRFPSARTGEPKKWYFPDEISDPGSLEVSGASLAPGERAEKLFDRDRYEGRISDERRLFYVACTRAKELLVLSTFRRYGDEERPGKPAPLSPFLQDIRSVPELGAELRTYGQGATPQGRRAPEKRTLLVDCGQLLTYSECPRKYYLRYECGFAPPLNPALGFGKLAHHVVTETARRVLAGISPTPEGVAEILRLRFYLPFATSEMRETMFQALHRRLTVYAERRCEDLRRVVDIEFPFEVPVDGARVRGRIDLILAVPQAGSDPAGAGENRGIFGSGTARASPLSVEIVDLKTSENRPPPELHKNQLRLYGKALRLLGREPVRLTIHDLESEDGVAVEVEPDEMRLGEFEENIRRWLWGIENARFEAKPGAHCEECDYKRVCRVS